jgi:polar amino acid transport system substrate-binding protein
MRFAWIDERPFNYEMDGQLTGCDVVLARAAITALGVPFEPVRTSFPELLAGLTEARWDVTTGMFVTPDRQQRAWFTRSIWSLSDGLLQEESPDLLRGYSDVARTGGPLAVLSGQVQRDHALDLGVSPLSLVEFDTYRDAAAAVYDGRVAAYASVALAHEQHLAASEEHRSRLTCVRVSPDEVPPAPGAFACASLNTRDALDSALNQLLGHSASREPSADPAAWARPHENRS